MVDTTIPDETAPVVAEVTAVPTPTNNATPSYTFSSDEAGSIAYGGSCSSATTAATVGNNTITFAALADGTYNNCTITVTDAASNASNVLAVTAFVVDTTPPVIIRIGESTQTIEVGTEYSDLGATASDNVDGDITDQIVTYNPVNTSVAGNYTITYTVSDEAGNPAITVSRMVYVVEDALNTAPVANAGPDQTVVGEGTMVTLDGSASSDVDGDDLSFSWILTAPTGSSATLANANNMHPTFTPDVNGTYIAQLRVNDGMIDSVLDTVAIIYSSSAEALTGGICFSFDDAYIESWASDRARDLFNQYNAKVTFSISFFNILSQDNIDRLRILKSDGHEIASHSLQHLDMDGLLTEGGYGPESEIERYIQEEIDPTIELMSAAGLPPVTFAAPFNADNTPYINALLERKFSFVRGGAWVGEGADITTIEEGYYTCSDRVNHRRHVHGFAGSESIENLNAAMDHAAATNSVVLIFDHEFSDDTNYGISWDKLEAILKMAHEKGLKFYTRIELQKHCLE